MKLARRDNQNALSALRVAISLTIVTLVPLLLYGSAPSRWSERGVLIEDAVSDDYALVNQGQLKNIATAAVAEMDAKLEGGAGDELHSSISSWLTPTPQTNDFAPANLGQLKAVAKPFYDRLIALGLIDFYPWLSALDPPDDFAVANLGQLKKLFSFEIPTGNSLDDPLGNRLAAGQRAGNLALEANAVWFWGNRFGVNSSFQSMYPRRVTGLAGVSSVSAGDDHLVALGKNGAVLTWGKNTSGQLGDGTNEDRSTPEVVPNLSNVISVKTGYAHTLVLQRDGTLVAWGDNYYGQLGNGDNIASSTPLRVVNLDDVHKIAAASGRNVALKNDGTVWCWGYVHYAWETGQDISNNTPLQVADLTDVIDIAAGYEHVVAVKADGTVWTWGSNYSNQLGNGASWSVFTASPVQVPNLTGVAKVASNFDHSLALLNDGTVWAWGFNAFGQLGDGTTQPRQRPVQVSGLTDVIAIATNYTYSLAMKADGTVWTWGDGSSGMLPGVDVHVPQQVGLGVFDTNHNGIDDRWEIEYLGNLNQAGDTDLDGDGSSDLQEFLRGTDPRDYFNGAPPVIEMVSGNNQLGDPGTLLPKPVTIRIKNSSGQLLINAPVEFRVSNGLGLVTTRPGEVLRGDVVVRSDAAGQASAYVMLPQTPGASARIAASPAVIGSSSTAGSVTFRASSRFILPATPMPTPNPNPGATPSPSPTSSPTATPFPPYRYAIVDLGKDVYPTRITNSGWVLLNGYTPEQGSQWYRWKAAVFEALQCNNGEPFCEAYVSDINEEGTAVGRLYGAQPASNEPAVGAFWRVGNSVSTKVASFPVPWQGPFFQPATLKYSACYAVDNSNAIFGQAVTEGSGGKLGERIGFYDFGYISNSCRWSLDGGLPAVMSNAKFEVVGQTWTGQTDSISRVNSSDHFIGSTRIAIAQMGFIWGPVTVSRVTGMIDGESVSFDPVDLNEAATVVGTRDGTMVIHTPGSPNQTIGSPGDTYALAINDHARPAPSPAAQSSPAPGPQPTPIPAPQILAWVGNVLAIWERQDDGQTWHPFGLEEMIPNMDGWTSLNPHDMNDTGAIVGTGWYIDPSNPRAQGEWHAFLLLPVELVPDFNRDGKIDDADRGRVSEDGPWCWWINDDDDELNTGGNDIPDSINPNFETTPILSGVEVGTIDGIRDLVDFFPLYLDIRGLLDMFPVEGSSSYTFKLRQEDGSLNFVYTDLRPDTTSNYLRKLNGDARDNATALGGTTRSNGAATNRITNQGVALDPAWLKQITTEGGGVILLEGRRKSDRPIVLEVFSHDHHKIAECRFALSLSPVAEMYRHKNLLAADNASGGSPDYAIGNDTLHSEPANCPDKLCNDKTFIFVHGYNVSPNAARGWNAEMFKRMYQAGSKAKFIGVTWHGDETHGTAVPDYQSNVDNAFATAKPLADLINIIGHHVIVVGHSLGNVVVGSAIEDWNARVEKYFMVDAAVPLESYGIDAFPDDAMVHPDWLSYQERLWASEWHANPNLSPNEARRELTWRNRFGHVSPSAFNFFSNSEDVLRKHTGDPTISSVVETALTGGRFAWPLQEKLKGRQINLEIGKCGSTYGGWRFSLNLFGPAPTSPEQAAQLSDASLINAPVFDPGFTNRVSPPPPNGELPPKEIHAGAPPWIIDLTNPTTASVTARAHRNQLLAEMFPSRSLPAGANLSPNFEDRNFDMPALYTNSWPPERGAIKDWLHSDVKVVAYSYIYGLFEKWTNLGTIEE
jgi:alpha-tubulin suppressor-like RCC1 family protein/pimeloyl-ACP methyl ester carboxylesterase